MTVDNKKNGRFEQHEAGDLMVNVNTGVSGEIDGLRAKVNEGSGYMLDKAVEVAMSGYERNLDVFRAFKMYDPDYKYIGAPAHPSREEVVRLLREFLTPAQADFIRMMKNPVFQMVPYTTYDRYTDVYTNFLSLFETGWVKRAWDNYDGNKVRNSWAPITNWEIAVSDDADFTMDGDPVDLPLGERMEWFDREWGRHGISGTDFRRYMMLAMARMAPGRQGHKRGQDCNTLLNGVPVFENAVCAGTLHTDDGLINLRDLDCKMVMNNLVIKPSVVIPAVRA